MRGGLKYEIAWRELGRRGGRGERSQGTARYHVRDEGLTISEAGPPATQLIPHAAKRNVRLSSPQIPVLQNHEQKWLFHRELYSVSCDKPAWKRV